MQPVQSEYSRRLSTLLDVIEKLDEASEEAEEIGAAALAEAIEAAREIACRDVRRATH